jgi:DNA polymerase III subunit gamma/tau
VFENILGQDVASERLRTDFLGERLPRSMLFEGPPLSAKLSSALELSRVLSCEREAAWNCPCPQCARHRTLSHQDVLLLGPKTFRAELAIGAQMLERFPGAAARYFFIRAARKLIRRFDSELYAGEESRLAKALPHVRSIMEGLDTLSPTGTTVDTVAVKDANKLLPICSKLEDLLPAVTPVFQIRAMEYWVRLAPLGKRKTIILEHADSMLEVSRNALLKILEEPPERVVFVLTSTRRRAIIPTILSRVRSYRFLQRTELDSRKVIERIFRDSASTSASIAEYIARYRPASEDAIESLAQDFVSALVVSTAREDSAFVDPALQRLMNSGQDINDVLSRVSSATSSFGASDEAYAWTFPAFIDKAGTVFTSLLREPGASIESQRLAERYAHLARDALSRFSSYNLQAGQLTERLADSFANAEGTIRS